MIRQPIIPQSPQDQRLARILTEGRGAAGAGEVPAGLSLRLDRCLRDGADSDAFAALAHGLEADGCVAAAMAAWERAAMALPGAVVRIPVYSAQAALARRLGRHFLADGLERRLRRLSGEGNDRSALPELEAEDLWVLSAAVDPDAYGEARAGLGATELDEDPLRDPGLTRRLFLAAPQATTTGIPEEYSFLVFHRDGEALVLVECDVLGDRFLGCREAAVALTILVPDHPARRAAEALALRQLEAITSWAGCPYLQLEVAAHEGGDETAPSFPLRHAWIDLSASMEAIRAAYRPTSRHCVRQGLAALTLVEGGDRRAELLAGYETVHRLGGKVPGLAPETLAACLAAGEIQGYLGLLEGEPAAMVLSSRHGGTVYDMATVKREGLRLPLSHALVDAAIAGARASGARRFHFGPLYEGGHLGAKMVGIATFKRGFASAFREARVVKLFA